jgi:hypothetical protein
MEPHDHTIPSLTSDTEPDLHDVRVMSKGMLPVRFRLFFLVKNLTLRAKKLAEDLTKHRVPSNRAQSHRYRIGYCPKFWLSNIPGLGLIHTISRRHLQF